MFDVADRHEILNVIAAYAHLVDNYKIDEWIALSTPDAIWEVQQPGKEPVRLTKPQYTAAVQQRFNAFKRTNHQRRHFWAGMYVVSQTTDEAHVFAECLIGGSEQGKVWKQETASEYEFFLRKIDGEWKINNWITRFDSDVQPGDESAPLTTYQFRRCE